MAGVTRVPVTRVAPGLPLGGESPLLSLELQPPPHEGAEVRRGPGAGTQGDVGHKGRVEADGHLMVTGVAGAGHRA